MCGIAGMSMQTDVNPSVMKALLLMAQIRGNHAAGIGTQEKVIKKAVPAREFIPSLEVPKTKNIVGHTRFATHGSKDLDENAHPFIYGNVVGTHNGHINNHDAIAREHKVKFNVDSESIFYLTSKSGFETVPGQITGSFAVAFLQDNKLHLYRKANPIFVGELDDGIVYGSSDKWLEVVGATSIESLNEEVLYVFEDGILMSTKEIKAKSYTSYNRQRDVYDMAPFDYTKMEGIKVSGRTYLYAPHHASIQTFIGGAPYRYWYEHTRRDFLFFSTLVSEGYYETYEINLNKIQHLRWLEREHHLFFNRLNLNTQKIKLLN